MEDTVFIIPGTWVREADKKWIFEPDPKWKMENFVRLNNGMSLQVLLTSVRERLNLTAANITLKLSYQYSEWVSMEDEELEQPQYITDDNEVQSFIEMRRAIEEVPLFVAIFRHTDAGTFTTQPPTNATLMSRSLAAGDVEANSDDEWHAFAISEIPLTLPQTAPSAQNANMELPSCSIPPKQNTRVVLPSRSIPHNPGGIEIREPSQPTRQLTPHAKVKNNGKGKMPAADDSDSDSDSDDDMIVPILRTTVSPTADERRPVRRRVIFGLPQLPDTAAEDVNSSSSAGETEAIQETDGLHWGKFDQALFDMLNDPANPALFGRDAPPVFNNGNETGVDSTLTDVKYEGDEIFVGRVFKSKTHCKIKLAIHAINRNFHFKTTRSNPSLLLAECVGMSCPWRVYAVLLDESGNFQIRQANLNHTCTVDERRNYHRLATTQVIGEILQSCFFGIKRGPSASAIRKILLDEFHVNVSYWKAWRARELAMEHAMGTMVGSYALLPTYLALLQASNEGTLCYLEHTNDAEGGARFKYCFVAYGASITGFPWMRKVVVVDGTSLKGKYGGCLLSAAVQYGNFQIFPLAFAVVDSENDQAWEWFFQKLNTFVPDTTDLVFISDRHVSIYAGLRKVYKEAHHAACVVHLWRNLKARYKSSRVANLMSSAARAFTITEFNRKFIEIQLINPACAAYLVDIGFEHWTRAHFSGQRWNIMDSNIAESWNAVIKEAREYRLITMFEYIRTTVMSWLALRRAKANRENGTLTPNVRKLVEENYDLSTTLAVREIGDLEFQVQDNNGDCFTVKLGPRACSCREYDEIGIPCVHALAAATFVGFPTDALVAPAYHVPTWRYGFVGKIYPVPSVGGLVIGSGTTSDILPPDVRRPPGRPHKVRILSRGEFKKTGSSSSRKCKRCGRSGHNKASCGNPI